MSQTDFAATASSSRGRLALIALLAGGVAIGGSPIFVRLSEIGPMATAFWRVALALIPLFLVSRMGAGESLTRPAGWRDMVALSVPGVFLAADLIAWHASIHVTTVANATLLANMAPVFVTGIGWLFLGTSVSRGFLIGLAIAILGVVVLKAGVSGFSAGACYWAWH